MQAYLAGLATGLSLILAIGAQNAFVLKQGLMRRHVFATCAFCALSDAVLIVLGDHQAAPDIALDDRPQVPLHIIGPAALVDQTAAWGLTPGLIPPRTQPAIPMERMRDLILTGFRPHPA